MVKYTKLSGSNLTLTPRQMHTRLHGVSAKGRRIVGGMPYRIHATGSKSDMAKLGRMKQREGRNYRIFKSYHYGDWELWLNQAK